MACNSARPVVDSHEGIISRPVSPTSNAALAQPHICPSLCWVLIGYIHSHLSDVYLSVSILLVFLCVMSGYYTIKDSNTGRVIRKRFAFLYISLHIAYSAGILRQSWSGFDSLGRNNSSSGLTPSHTTVCWFFSSTNKVPSRTFLK